MNATPSAPRVFISYRRSETAGHAGRLYDAMASRFGDANVFMDVGLQPGVDFVERITSVVAACDVLLVVMGPNWARPRAGETHARIADPDDFVGLEVATALCRSDVTVIPLLVAEASMPEPDELPERLRALARRNALELSDQRWHYDVGRLMALLEQLLAQPGHPVPRQPPSEHARAAVDRASPVPLGYAAKPSHWIRQHKRALSSAGGIVVAGLLAFLVLADDKPTTRSSATTLTTSGEPAVESGARPAHVPSNCKDKGLTRLAKDVEAQREWQCPLSTPPNVTNPALTYLQYADTADAHRSFLGSKDYELSHGWKPCGSVQAADFARARDLEIWCVRSTADATVQISWRGETSTVVGVLTCDPPTTVASAMQAWLSLV